MRPFVVSVHGVQLKLVDHLQLGTLALIAPNQSFIEDLGVSDSKGRLPGTIKAMGRHPWLIGSMVGTTRVATQRFQALARLATGMLAVSAASTYQRGAEAFRIGAILSAEDSVGPCESMFWDDVDKELGISMTFRKSQDYVIDATVAAQLREASTFAHSFEIFREQKRNELQEAIARAVYWFADAHRDPVAVMRFVKYWSCIETFFSAKMTGTTNAAIVGLSSVLTFGKFGFLPVEDYRKTKAKADKLYKLRSLAVHAAHHEHVSSTDVAELSQWTAWLIINMIAFAESHYSALEAILKESFDIDAQQVGVDSAPSRGAEDLPTRG